MYSFCLAHHFHRLKQWNHAFYLCLFLLNSNWICTMRIKYFRYTGNFAGPIFISNTWLESEIVNNLGCEWFDYSMQITGQRSKQNANVTTDAIPEKSSDLFMIIVEDEWNNRDKSIRVEHKNLVKFEFMTETWKDQSKRWVLKRLKCSIKTQICRTFFAC